MNSPRPPRADAVRNRRRILATADELIGAAGSDVGMDDIAAAAGVAVGTLYRHFPTKTALVAAVIAEYVASVADDAEATLRDARQGRPAADQVVGFLSRIVESAAHNHAIKMVAETLGVTDHGDTADEQRAGAALGELLALGQAAGDIRPEVTVDDIYLLMATAPNDQPEPIRQRWLELVLPGLVTPRWSHR